MRFGKTLRASTYQPWKDKYVDYAKLKSLLREDNDDDDAEWTEDDEKRFCDEILTTQLEKVAQFQQDQFGALKERVDTAFEQLKDLAPSQKSVEEQENGESSEAARTAPLSDEQTGKLKALEKELDDVMNEVKRLKKFSAINYTAFLKIVKKHDRKRGEKYKIRPIMQLSLARRSFNSEAGYSPLLNKLSLMYFAIRQQLEDGSAPPQVDLETRAETRNGERYTAHKFWVHPDNLLEVKTMILRRLPALVYSPQSSKELDGNDSPAITSLYFDNSNLDLYSDKVDLETESASFRLRWYGQLTNRPEIFVEDKFADAGGNSHEVKFSIKDKYVQSFLDGQYSMDKTILKMERQGQSQSQIEDFKATVTKIQSFVQERKLEPVLRASYTRTAFQKPADDRVRVSIDDNVAFIREDTFDKARPCRDPANWHRAEIDNSNMSYPFKNINQAEVSKFPYAILEIKLKEDENLRRPSWVEDLMASHLVYPCPRFSKFVHGIASLFEDYVHNLPFWLSKVETDIRKEPQEAFDEEEQRRAQRADDQLAIGSLIGAGAMSSSYKAAQSSPIGKSYLSDRLAADSRKHLSQALHQKQSGAAEEQGGQSRDHQRTVPQEDQDGSGNKGYGTISTVFPGFDLTKYSRMRRAQKAQQLPEGVIEPIEWIKNAGQLKVEPKVWLANERTFLKWQHICILQGSIALGLYTAAGDDVIAEAIGILYILIAIFAGLWGYYMQRTRRELILERSGKDFDNMIGPMIISAAMMVALILNFALQYRAAINRLHGSQADDLKDELR